MNINYQVKQEPIKNKTVVEFFTNDFIKKARNCFELYYLLLINFYYFSTVHDTFV